MRYHIARIGWMNEYMWKRRRARWPIYVCLQNVCAVLSGSGKHTRVQSSQIYTWSKDTMPRRRRRRQTQTNSSPHIPNICIYKDRHVKRKLNFLSVQFSFVFNIVSDYVLVAFGVWWCGAHMCGRFGATILSFGIFIYKSICHQQKQNYTKQQVATCTHLHNVTKTRCVIVIFFTKRSSARLFNLQCSGCWNICKHNVS